MSSIYTSIGRYKSGDIYMKKLILADFVDLVEYHDIVFVTWLLWTG